MSGRWSGWASATCRLASWLVPCQRSARGVGAKREVLWLEVDLIINREQVRFGWGRGRREIVLSKKPRSLARTGDVLFITQTQRMNHTFVARKQQGESLPSNALARSLARNRAGSEPASERAGVHASELRRLYGPSTAVFNSEYVEYRLEHRATGPCGA
jgi:hypothetical protein